MADPLRGRVALVTGAGRGLGRAYALALARLGCAVVVNSPPRADGASAPAVVDEIVGTGGRATAHIGSVANASGGNAAVDAALAAYGRIDVLVANAGVVINRPFPETTDEDLQSMFDVHLAGPFAATRRALPRMQEQKWGRIILTGSGSAAFGLENQSAYAAAKAAVVGLCNVLRNEADGDVCVNVVLPVAPPPGRTPASRRIAGMFAGRAERLDPAWVAPLVCLLASEHCPGTGGVYSAVGGRYARVFTAVGRGWMSEGSAPPSLSDIARHVGEIVDGGRFGVPGSIIEEIEAAAHIGPDEERVGR